MCGAVEEPKAVKHGVREVLWTNLGEGWFFTCLCGWQTSTDRSLSCAAEELEDHWKDAEVKP
jgi:hypothetical protein